MEGRGDEAAAHKPALEPGHENEHEQPEPEPQADKPNLLNTIINNPVWLALLFLTIIVLALVILA